MGGVIVNIACILVVIWPLCARTIAQQSPQCVSELDQLYRTTSTCMNRLTSLGQPMLPSFFYKNSRKRCWGYLNYYDPNSPFPSASLTSSVSMFKGSKFYQRTHEVFLPFLLATDKILDVVSTSSTARPLVKDINFNLGKLMLCLHTKSSVQHLLPKRQYSIPAHRTSVKKCLKSAKAVPTPTSVQLIQYKDIMEELFFALTEIKYIISLKRK